MHHTRSFQSAARLSIMLFFIVAFRSAKEWENATFAERKTTFIRCTRLSCLVYRSQIAFFAVLSACMGSSAIAADGLERMHYNHPGLTVDLGVGLWAWPIPCDADADGDYDLIVSCPDKPSNGVWLFENADGDTAKTPLPTFKPAVKLSSTVHYVMPSYVGGQMRVLSPGAEYTDFTRRGLTNKVNLPVDAKFYVPTGKQSKGPKVRHNQWRYVDYDGDSNLDLIVGIEDWSYYGWDDAWDARGEWINGRLHGFVLLLRNEGTNNAPRYASPVKVDSASAPIDTFGCPSPNFEDFDGDGDLDLICGDIFRIIAGPNGSIQGPAEFKWGYTTFSVNDWDQDGLPDVILNSILGDVVWLKNIGTHQVDDTVKSFEPHRGFLAQEPPSSVRIIYASSVSRQSRQSSLPIPDVVGICKVRIGPA